MSCDSNHLKTAYSVDLLPQHVDILKKSSILPEVAGIRGYRSLQSRNDIRQLGFQPRQGNIPALVIPIRNVDGKEAFSLIRPDHPRIKNNREITYEQPQGTTLQLDVPTPTLAVLSDPSTPLWIADGPRQTDSLVSTGRASIAVLGYQAWRHFRKTSRGRPVLSDWEKVKLEGREVIIAFGSNVFASPAGKSEIQNFTTFLRGHGANVKYVIPKPGPNGERVAVDDLLANGEDIDKLMTNPPQEMALSPMCPGPAFDHPYRIMPEGFFISVDVGDDVEWRRLTNWVAQIVGDVLYDDGLEQRRLFEIEASVNGRIKKFSLTPSEFEEMAWPLTELGPRAITTSGYGVKDHIRAAIQYNSPKIDCRKVYAHTGWMRLNNKWGYLHAGGIICTANPDESSRIQPARPALNNHSDNELHAAGPLGPFLEDSIETIQTQLPDELSLFSLPNPPKANIVANRVHCAMALLDSAADRISFPLLAMVVRAVIAPLNFSVHLVGRTGVFKTALATVVQQFFGAGLDADHLVGHWQGTANSLESLAYHLKDAILLIDDFSPTGARGDIQRAHREAERLLRAKGNAGGRSRCRPDGSFRTARSPRAALLLTGEDIPEGHSLRARLLTIEVKEGDINSGKLKYCQNPLASNGLFAEFLSAFIQWLAPQYDEVLKDLRNDQEEWKNHDIPDTVHRRTYHAVRELEYGFIFLLKFAVDCHAIEEKSSEEFHRRCWNALKEVAFSQEQYHQFANPVDQFKYLLNALFSSKKVHVADFMTYRAPVDDPDAWGYRSKKIPIQSANPNDNTSTTTHKSDDGGDSDFSRLLGKSSSHQDEGKEEEESSDQMGTIWVPCGTKNRLDHKKIFVLDPGNHVCRDTRISFENGNSYTPHVTDARKTLADVGVVNRDEKRNRIRHRVTVEGRRQPVLMVPLQWHVNYPGWGFPDEDHEEDQDIDELLGRSWDDTH